MTVSHFDHVAELPALAPSEPKRKAGQRPKRIPGLAGIRELGEMAVLFLRTCASIAKRPLEFRALVYQLNEMGVRSVAIACTTAVFTGMVMTVQFAFGLERFGGKDYVSRVVGVSMVRELAPVLTALVVGSRIGAGMAAEIGSMAVTEQLIAIRALGADPVKKLVMPRMLACVILLPLLAAFADVVGFAGAMTVAAVQFGTSMHDFFRSALDSVEMTDLMSGLIKMPFFGVITAMIACSNGLNTRGGTEGVGRSTTRTVVAISVSILLADFFLTKVLIMVWPAD
jgi:phospholipid/cholesterol/gamma-HCH transport system permease protein